MTAVHFQTSPIGTFEVQTAAGRLLRLAFMQVNVSGAAPGEQLLVTLARGTTPFFVFASGEISAAVTVVSFFLGATETNIGSAGVLLNCNSPLPNIWWPWSVKVNVVGSIGLSIDSVSLGYQLGPE